MDDHTLDLLLIDARDRYKADLDRQVQIYTRSGIYLAVLAIFIGALGRFLDKRPPLACTLPAVIFYAGCAVLLVATVVTLYWIMAALWGRSADHTSLPSEWIKYVAQVAPKIQEPFVLSSSVQSPSRLSRDIKRGMLFQLSTASGRNFETNVVRFAYLHRASKSLTAGLIGLLVSGSGYVLFVVQEPALGPSNPVWVVDGNETYSYK